MAVEICAEVAVAQLVPAGIRQTVGISYVEIEAIQKSFCGASDVLTTGVGNVSTIKMRRPICSRGPFSFFFWSLPARAVR